MAVNHIVSDQKHSVVARYSKFLIIISFLSVLPGKFSPILYYFLPVGTSVFEVTVWGYVFIKNHMGLAAGDALKLFNERMNVITMYAVSFRLRYVVMEDEVNPNWIETVIFQRRAVVSVNIEAQK